jgi:predicted RNA-binding protein YlxR (DUF448 family)
MDPLRTCVGCGSRAGQRELARLRIEGERVVIDRNRSGGRGAWVHPSAGCLEKAIKRRAFAKAFRGKAASIDAAALRVELTGSARKD